MKDTPGGREQGAGTGPGNFALGEISQGDLEPLKSQDWTDCVAGPDSLRVWSLWSVPAAHIHTLTNTRTPALAALTCVLHSLTH